MFWKFKIIQKELKPCFQMANTIYILRGEQFNLNIVIF